MRNKINNRPQTEPISSPSNHKTANNYERVILPLPPQAGEETRFEMEIYVRFMRHLRDVPTSRMEIKILAAIQFAADVMETGDALVTKTLVDLGLKAPRKAFPVSFLDFADKGIMRTNWDHGSLPASVVKLHHHWNKIGEDRFSYGMAGQYSVYNENHYVNV
ncbi:MAG: hypothetical protein CO093_07295 [Alphaproteobacteria bacterium CG_4_9_14_3_um_filter_47_13]|nr:MAG: hypothetical protein CO093_07295 [Alphaproteobacteria bacterium CG_4_9_14_3_um_filter_47_13]